MDGPGGRNGASKCGPKVPINANYPQGRAWHSEDRVAPLQCPALDAGPALKYLVGFMLAHASQRGNVLHKYLLAIASFQKGYA